MRDINCLMITKTGMNWNLTFVISKFKDECRDNTKSKKTNKNGQVGWKNVLQCQAFQKKVDIDIKIVCKRDMLFFY